MKNTTTYPFLILVLFLCKLSLGQDIRINEVMSLNNQTIVDEDGDTPDWIELYNYGTEAIDIGGFGISDSSTPYGYWRLPSFILNPKQYLLVFASDKDKKEAPIFWKTIIDNGDEWKYHIPKIEPAANWKLAQFKDTAWLNGATSIGYGDDDDSTIVESALAIYLRKSFFISEVNQINEAVLHMDYDDGFIAYLNDVEIARSGLTGQVPAFNEAASSHEALIYSGSNPEAFIIADLNTNFKNGENILAVQVHNTDTNSSDMTIIPILSIGSERYENGYVSDYIDLSHRPFHANFKISSKGESIFLVNDSGVIIDSLYTGLLPADVSIGYHADDTDSYVYYSKPTPGSPNGDKYFTSLSGEVEFELKPGVYSSPTQISLKAESKSDSIYYTLDGTEPTKQSLFYTEPFTLIKSKAIRARLIENDGLPGKIATASYLIGINHSLPIISLSADPYDFFDETHGIYMKGPNASEDFPYWDANFWQDWERPIHVEMFETDGSLAFSANAGVKIFGAYSRGNDQNSLSLFFRKSYGDGPINYQIFPEKNLKEYSSLVLRNSGNDWNNSMMRDGLLSALFHDTVDTQGFRPAVIYINGEYWGIQNIREKVNEHFIANNHNLDSDSIEILEYSGSSVLGSEQHYKNLMDYVSRNDLAIAENYTYIKTQIDIVNYLYYVSANVFINNYDWPASNIKFWRENNNSGKWRWIAYDKDAGFGIWDPSSYSENRLSYMMNYSTDWPNPGWSTLLFRRLMENESCKNLFINIYADQLNSVWKPTEVHRQIDEKKEALQKEIVAHLDRWNGSYSFWTRNMNSYYLYAIQRPIFALNHIIEEFELTGKFNIELDVSDEAHGSIRINTLSLSYYPWQGNYLNDIPIEIDAVPAPGYHFVAWEGIDTSLAKTTISLTNDISVTAIFEEGDNPEQKLVSTIRNYPNPFSRSTQIEFKITEEDFIKISVLDLKGIEVEILFEGIKEAGKHELVWQVDILSAGIYLLKFESRNEVVIHKAIIQ